MSYSLQMSQDYGDRQAKLLAAHRDVGARRGVVAKILEELDTSPAVGVSFNRSRAVVDGNGELWSAGAALDEESPDEREIKAPRFEADPKTFLLHPSLKASMLGAAHGNKLIGKVIIPCGVCLILGQGGVGKTPLAHAMAAHGSSSYGVVRAGEPLSGYGATELDTAYDIAKGLVSSSNVVIDSIKDVLSSGEGGAMKSGLSRRALTQLSVWAAQACDLGTTLYVPVNPSTPDPEVTALLVEAARSNATSVVVHEQGQSWQYYGRMGEGLNRTSAKFILDYNSGVPLIASAQEGRRHLHEREVVAQLSSTISDYNAVVDRLIRS